MLLCLNETFCDGTISDGEIVLPGYSIVRKDRIRHGGGVAMYIRDTLNFTRRCDLENDDVQCIWVEIRCKQRQPVLMSSVYRPPSSTVEFLENLTDIIEKASCECKEMIVLGDFNSDVANVNASNPILSCMNLLQMEQLIQEPNRLTHLTQTTIDLIFSTHPDLVSACGVLQTLISDHYLIYGIHNGKCLAVGVD